jgi:NAD(P)-dependent dehydrogenase (short-subunit alcohol dehydrogenase family)
MAAEYSGLITGGSAGIGLAIGRRLALRDWDITICGRNRERLGEATVELSDLGKGKVSAVDVNLAKAGAAVHLMDRHRAEFGRLDMLVNNAARGLAVTVEDVTESELDLELDLNLKSAFLLTREGIPLLRKAAAERGRSHVVNVSSLASRESPAKASIYAATKAALNSFSQTAHSALSRDGIHVCALLPGLVATPGASWAEQANRAPMLSTEDVAASVDFLLSLSSDCFVPEIMMTGPGDSIYSTTIDWDLAGD